MIIVKKCPRTLFNPILIIKAPILVTSSFVAFAGPSGAQLRPGNCFLPTPQGLDDPE